MVVPFSELVGPSYEYADHYAAVEKTVNWYLNVNESKEEKKFIFSLAPSPCNQAFGPLPVPAPFNQPNRGLISYRGVAYGVNGSTVFRVDGGGKYYQIGAAIENDGLPVSMAGNGNGQIGISSAGVLYVIVVASNTLTSVLPTAEGFLGSSFLTFQDGYLIALTPESNQFQISGTDSVPIGDMTQWDAANISIQEGQADLLSCLISSREYLRLVGTQRSQVYADVGAQGSGGFPFQSYNETFIETGTVAPYSMVDMGDCLIWIGQDVRGVHTVWRDSAFQPRRISTFAVEQQWATYPGIGDARAFGYIWKGHLIWRVTFPEAQKTWEYDQTVSDLVGRPVWVERNFTDWQGNQTCRPEQSHCFCYGIHLVGSTGLDGNPGAIYQMMEAPYTDCAQNGAGQQIQSPLVRDRICPHIWKNNNRIIYSQLRLESARGIGLDGAPPVGANPQILLRWSNDGGNAFGPEYQIPASKSGQYGRPIYKNQLGYGRDRVFWIRCADPVYWGFENATLYLQECAS